MAWVSELESTEFQTMFISHIYATEVLVNYGQSYCECFMFVDAQTYPDQPVEDPAGD